MKSGNTFAAVGSSLLLIYAGNALAQESTVNNDTVVVTGTALKVDTPLLETLMTPTVLPCWS